MSDVRTFRLMRDIDHTGVSGPGRVADGVVWPDGTVTLRWVGDRPSTVNWAQLADAEYVHGHGGATRFVFDDADTPALASSEQRNGAVGRVQALLKREPGIFSRQEEADFRAVLAERDALAARVAEVERLHTGRLEGTDSLDREWVAYPAEEAQAMEAELERLREQVGAIGEVREEWAVRWAAVGGYHYELCEDEQEAREADPGDGSCEVVKRVVVSNWHVVGPEAIQ